MLTNNETNVIGPSIYFGAAEGKMIFGKPQEMFAAPLNSGTGWSYAAGFPDASSTVIASASIQMSMPIIGLIHLNSSTNVSAGGTTTTTAQLTPPAGKSTSAFTAGYIDSDTAPTPAINIGAAGADKYTELEWVIYPETVVTSGDVYQFRVTSSGTVLGTYTWTPALTIGSSLNTYGLLVALGAYSENGFVTSLVCGAAGGSPYYLYTIPGSYSGSGQVTEVLSTRILQPSSGIYSESGQSLNSLAGRILQTLTGSYSEAGFSAVLTYVSGGKTYTLSLNSGIYLESGLSAGILSTRLLNLSSGGYTENGVSLKDSYTGTIIDSIALRDSSSHQLVAIQFTPGSSYDLLAVSLVLYQASSPSGNIWVSIYNDSGSGYPGATNYGDSANVSTLNVSSSLSEIQFTFSSKIPLVSGTKYWIVLHGDFPINGTSWIYVCARSSVVGYNMAVYNGVSWSTLTNEAGWYKIFSGASLLTARLLYNSPGSYSETGDSASILAIRKLLLSPGSYSETGDSASILAIRKLLLSPGSYVESGQSVQILSSRILNLSTGSYLEIGKSSLPKVIRILSLTSGAYLITGIAAALTKTGINYYTFSVNPGSFSESGLSSNILVKRILSLGFNSYSMSGDSSKLLSSRIISTLGGSYSELGSSLLVLAKRSLALSSGSYVASGKSSSVLKNSLVNTSSGIYSENGTILGFKWIHILQALQGAYTLGGQTASLYHYTPGAVPSIIILSNGSLAYKITSTFYLRL